MKKLIACCGFDCQKCEARKGTIKNDCKLSEAIAIKCCVLNNTHEIRYEETNCMGCRTEGVKSAYCGNLCEVRKCVEFKGLNTCGDCIDIDFCDMINKIFEVNPKCKENIHPNYLLIKTSHI